MNDAYSQFHRFLDIQNSVGESAKGKLGGRLNDFPSNYYYTNITYNKSLVMWKYMQDTLGKDTILKALQEYYSTYKLKIATPDNLYACLDNAFADASALMKNWVASVWASQIIAIKCKRTWRILLFISVHNTNASDISLQKYRRRLWQEILNKPVVLTLKRVSLPAQLNLKKRAVLIAVVPKSNN